MVEKGKRKGKEVKRKQQGEVGVYVHVLIHRDATTIPVPAGENKFPTSERQTLLRLCSFCGGVASILGWLAASLSGLGPWSCSIDWQRSMPGTRTWSQYHSGIDAVRRASYCVIQAGMQAQEQRLVHCRRSTCARYRRPGPCRQVEKGLFTT